MTKSNDSVDVVIAGGSYAGLALACALSVESGGELRVTVVSPAYPGIGADAVAGDARGSALARGSLRMLDRLGVWGELKAHAQVVSEIELTDSKLDDAVRPTVLRYGLEGSLSKSTNSDPNQGGSPPTLTLPHEGGGNRTGVRVVEGAKISALAPGAEHLPAMVIVENQRLGAALHRAAAAAAGVTLVRGVAIENFAADLDGVRVTLSDGRVIGARLLVAADGGRSKLRALAGIGTTGWPYAQAGIVTIVAPELPHEGRAVQHFLPAGPFALLPMTGNRVCVTWTEDADEARRILALDAGGFRAEVEKRFGFKLGVLKTISAPQTWPLEVNIARSLIAPRFALVGDAAHTLHPIAGQGLNLGFRDVAALAECVIDAARLGLDIGQADVLERYQQWRRFDNLASAAGFDALNRLFSTENTLARSARGAALGVVDRLPGVKAWLVGEASGEGGDVPRMMGG